MEFVPRSCRNGCVYRKLKLGRNREKDRTTIEETFRRLVELVNSLDEEQKRAAKEGLSEDELAMFDLLQKEGLDKAARERVKQASMELLASIKARRALTPSGNFRCTSKFRNNAQGYACKRRISDGRSNDEQLCRSMTAVHAVYYAAWWTLFRHEHWAHHIRPQSLTGGVSTLASVTRKRQYGRTKTHTKRRTISWDTHRKIRMRYRRIQNWNSALTGFDESVRGAVPCLV